MDFVHFKEFYAAGILWIKKNYKYPYTKKKSANQWTKAIRIHAIRKSDVYCSSIGTNLKILESSQNVSQNWNPDKTILIIC